MRLIDALELKRSIACSSILEDGKTLEQIIDEQPTIEPKRKTEWIPCSERLPEEGREVLVCLTDWQTGKQMRVVSYRTDFNMWHGYGRYNEKCVAWMPLPEPWKEDNYEWLGNSKNCSSN